MNIHLQKAKVTRRILPDADVKSYYDEHKADFEEPEQIHARHILKRCFVVVCSGHARAGLTN